MLYGSETWRYKKEMVILRTERAIIRVMCGMKLMNRSIKELMTVLGIEESSSIWWYGLVLKREDENALIKTFKIRSPGLQIIVT